jgi:hypothetical protein
MWPNVDSIGAKPAVKREERDLTPDTASDDSLGHSRPIRATNRRIGARLDEIARCGEFGDLGAVRGNNVLTRQQMRPF